jgi:hypothetical protein
VIKWEKKWEKWGEIAKGINGKKGGRKKGCGRKGRKG